MWDDFQIGEQLQNTTAIVVHDYNISHNNDEYWWSSDEYGIGGRINKLSEVGQLITQMIRSRASPKSLDHFVLAAALGSMTPDAIANMIETLQGKAFRNGLKEKAAQIRHCLYIPEEG